MKLLIYGAGTIGLTYGWKLSSQHTVEYLARTEKPAPSTYHVTIHDLRAKPHRDVVADFSPCFTAAIADDYDAVLVTVNRCQLGTILPSLATCRADIIFLQNNWDILGDVSPFLTPDRYLIGFPSQVGGGRDGDRLEVNLYDEGTLLGEADGRTTRRLLGYQEAFEKAGFNVAIRSDMPGWLAVHYLQQSVSAGAIVKAGGYDAFADDYAAVKDMIYAYREGVDVCRARGIDARHVPPANMLGYPAPLVARLMRRFFQHPDTGTMVKGHMRHGLGEWVAGYLEVLDAGVAGGVDMHAWASYRPYIAAYLASHPDDAAAADRVLSHASQYS
jgi:ketopantoate reductase